MNRLTLAGLLAFRILAAAPDEAPTADAILDRFIEVTGGRAAYEKIHSEEIKGTVSFASTGIKGTLSIYQAEPDLSYSDFELEGVGKIESGTDGEVAWERSPMTGPRVKSGAEREDMLREMTFNAHLNWRKLYEKAELAGSAIVGDDDCYKVVLTPKSGLPATEYFSKKSGLLVKHSMVHSTQMGDVLAESVLKDYRAVGALTMPFARVETAAGQQIEAHLDSIRLNTEIPKAVFALPDEIKALLRKNGATDDKK